MTDSRGVQEHCDVAIVGTGFGGLGMAIRLSQRGMRDFLLFERSKDVGGVWRDNTYPGCACDVDSHLYSFSFAQNPSWSRKYAPSSEIHDYLKDCVARFSLQRHLRFGHDVRAATWQPDIQRWLIDTTGGSFTARHLVGAVGGLSEPAVPNIPGLASFAGTTFHSARWNHAHDLRGRHVAVLGTGASAVQFVPHLQPLVARLKVFQRTPPWVLPRGDRPFGKLTKALFARTPLMRNLFRVRLHARREVVGFVFFDARIAALASHVARRFLRRSVKDAALRAKLTPDYTLGCKRVLLSDDYFPSLTKANVELVTEEIAEICPKGIRTRNGVLHEVDTLILGTGFAVQAFPFAARVFGSTGASLSDTWRVGGTRAHLGTTVAGFPNFFLLQGPNTGLGHSSVVTMIEAQVEHILALLDFMRVRSLSVVEPTQQAQNGFAAYVDKKMRGTVWTAGRCASWYLDAAGRNSTLWPRTTLAFRSRLAGFSPSEYRFT